MQKVEVTVDSKWKGTTSKDKTQGEQELILLHIQGKILYKMSHNKCYYNATIYDASACWNHIHKYPVRLIKQARWSNFIMRIDDICALSHFSMRSIL